MAHEDEKRHDNDRDAANEPSASNRNAISAAPATRRDQEEDVMSVAEEDDGTRQQGTENQNPQPQSHEYIAAQQVAGPATGSHHPVGYPSGAVNMPFAAMQPQMPHVPYPYQTPISHGPIPPPPPPPPPAHMEHAVRYYEAQMRDHAAAYATAAAGAAWAAAQMVVANAPPQGGEAAVALASAQSAAAAAATAAAAVAANTNPPFPAPQPMTGIPPPQPPPPFAPPMMLHSGHPLHHHPAPPQPQQLMPGVGIYAPVSATQPSGPYTWPWAAHTNHNDPPTPPFSSSAAKGVATSSTPGRRKATTTEGGYRRRGAAADVDTDADDEDNPHDEEESLGGGDEGQLVNDDQGVHDVTSATISNKRRQRQGQLSSSRMHDGRLQEGGQSTSSRRPLHLASARSDFSAASSVAATKKKKLKTSDVMVLTPVPARSHPSPTQTPTPHLQHQQPGSYAPDGASAMGGASPLFHPSMSQLAISASSSLHHPSSAPAATMRTLWEPQPKERVTNSRTPHQRPAGNRRINQHPHRGNTNSTNGPIQDTDRRGRRRKNRRGVGESGSGDDGMGYRSESGSDAGGGTASDGGRASRGKKNRPDFVSSPYSQIRPSATTPHVFGSQASVLSSMTSSRVFNPVGRTGVSALHELCDNRRWQPPRFVDVAGPTLGVHVSDADGDTETTAKASLSNRDFVIAVWVNDEECGRGRGGTKASAKQDAARRALTHLLQGVLFDENGVVLGIGTGEAVPSKVSAIRSSLSLTTAATADELAPTLASQLAIDPSATAAGGARPTCASPTLSEDSSFGTPSGTFMLAAAGTAPNVYPCASTTSGMSSASEDGGASAGNPPVDDDDYYSSRGASVCSALLHAMAQIDERIREPPTYSFDVRPNPATLMAAAAAGGDTSFGSTAQSVADDATASTTIKSAKRKGARGGSRGVAVGLKRRSALNSAGTSVTVHRNSFACTGTLLLYRQESTIPEENNGGGENELLGERSQAFTQESGQPAPLSSDEGVVVQRLEAVGTGATKREARHVASAKLLALLFPDCDGMVEVIAAAEAAREEYAATKARAKQSKRARSMLYASSASSSATSVRQTRRVRRAGLVDIRDDTELFGPLDGEPPLPNSVMQRIRNLCGWTIGDAGGYSQLSAGISSEGIISVATLSLSESGESPEAENDGRAEGGDPRRYLARQKQLEDEVEAAIQMLRELDDDRHTSLVSCRVDDIGRTEFRRARSEDAFRVQKLLKKARSSSSSSTTAPTDGMEFTGILSDGWTISPLCLINACDCRLDSEDGETVGHCCDQVSARLWGGNSFVLLLTRAITGVASPPLGCAVLTLSFAMTQGRVLRVSYLAHEEFFPRERFVESLEKFAKAMKCGLDVSVQSPSGDIPAAAAADADDVRALFTSSHLTQMLRRYVDPKGCAPVREVAVAPTGNSTALHSVKEEDEEEEDDDDEVDSGKETKPAPPETSEKEVPPEGEQPTLEGGSANKKPPKRTRVS